MLVSRLVWLIALVSVIGLVIGRFGTDCDACDTVNIGYSLWLSAAVVSIMTLGVARLRGSGDWWPIAAMTALVIFSTIRAPMPIATACGTSANTNRLKIVSFNAWTDNRQPTVAAQWILDQQPDLVVLLEAKGGAASLPALLAHALPYQASCLAKLPCSTWVLSRLRPKHQMPLGQGDVENRKGLSAAALSLTMPNGRSITMVGVHLSRLLPLGRQRRELAELEGRLAAYDPASLIIAGDFNAPQDNMMLRRFATNYELGRTPTSATWPTASAYPYIPNLLAIDHIFLGRAIGFLKSDVGPQIGSDHLPVFVTICLNEQR
jgi:endonuclease/exonuclease/phosphatase (EEP) superfamily protein YafD